MAPGGPLQGNSPAASNSPPPASTLPPEEPGWRLVQHSKPRGAVRQPPRSYAAATKRYVTHVHVYGLPSHLLNHQGLYKILSQIPTPLDIATITFPPTSPNPSASIRSYNHLIGDILQQHLPNLVGEPVQIIHNNPRPPTGNPPPQRPQSYSCVIRDIPEQLTPNDILREAREQQISLSYATRIISKTTNRPTRLFRLFSLDKAAIDHLLTNGILLGPYRRFAEPSAPLPPRPIQCSNCMDHHPPSQPCAKPTTCGVCAGPHTSSKCTSSQIKCAQCGGTDHPAFSAKCPKKLAAAANVTDETAVPPKFSPPPHPLSLEEKMIQVIAATLCKLRPTQTAAIQEAISASVAEVLGLRAIFVNASSVHLVTCPLTPTPPHTPSTQTT